MIARCNGGSSHLATCDDQATPEGDAVANEAESDLGIFIGTILAACVLFGILGGLVGLVWGWALGVNLWLSVAISATIAAFVCSYLSLSIAIQRSEARRREMSFARNFMFIPLFVVVGVVGLAIGGITQVIL